MGDATSMIDLNDSDILKIEEVLRHLNRKQGERHSLEGFAREARERFGNIGFRVDVNTYETPTPGVFAFDLVIRERLEGAFDPDQMVHETVSDILGLGTGGVIKTNGGLWTPPGS